MLALVAAKPTSASAASATIAESTATTTAAVADHLGQTRINLLLSLLEDIHKITRLLLV